MLKVFHALSTPFSTLSKFKSPPFYSIAIKEYSHKGEGEDDKEQLMTEMERAQSTAEVMKKLGEDMEERRKPTDEKSDQGFTSHTSDKFMEAAEEAVGGDSGGNNPEDVKTKYK